MTKKKSKDDGVGTHGFAQKYTEIIEKGEGEGWDLFAVFSFFSGSLSQALVTAVKKGDLTEEDAIEMAEAFHQMTIRSIRKHSSSSPKKKKKEQYD